MTARTLMALLALACAGCSRETPRTYYLVRESGLYAQRGHLLVTDFKMRLADTTVWGERMMAVSPGIVVFRDTDDTLRGADAVRFLFPRDTTGGRR